MLESNVNERRFGGTSPGDDGREVRIERHDRRIPHQGNFDDLIIGCGRHAQVAHMDALVILLGQQNRSSSR